MYNFLNNDLCVIEPLKDLYIICSSCRGMMDYGLLIFTLVFLFCLLCSEDLGLFASETSLSLQSRKCYMEECFLYLRAESIYPLWEKWVMCALNLSSKTTTGFLQIMDHSRLHKVIECSEKKKIPQMSSWKLANTKPGVKSLKAACNAFVKF